MTNTPIEDLENELLDPEFRRLYGAADAKAELALALSFARKKAGLTQQEMAERLGVKQPYVARLESGDANPTIGAVGSMMAQLDLRIRITTDKLLERKTPTILAGAGGYVPVVDATASAAASEWGGSGCSGYRGQPLRYSISGTAVTGAREGDLRDLFVQPVVA